MSDFSSLNGYAVKDKTARENITKMQSNITKLSSDLTTTNNKVSTNTTNISTNASNISKNASNISKNTTAINELNSKFVYSEEETVIGTFLGKPLYRKVFKITSMTRNAVTSFTHNINLSRVIKVYGSAGKFMIPNYGSNAVQVDYVATFFDLLPNTFNYFIGKNIEISETTPLYLVLEYIK